MTGPQLTVFGDGAPNGDCDAGLDPASTDPNECPSNRQMDGCSIAFFDGHADKLSKAFLADK